MSIEQPFMSDKVPLLLPHPAPQKVDKPSDKLIADLADVLNLPYRRVRQKVKIIAQQKLCMHCARCFIIEYLSTVDRCKYDGLYREAHECLCELCY